MTDRNGVLTLIGGILIHLTLGTVYCWGNSTVYITSWLRIEGDNADLTTQDTLGVYASALCGQGFFMYLGGVLENAFGARLACFVAIMLVSVSNFLSSYCDDFISLLVAQFVFGIGIGIGYVAPMKAGYRHYPTRTGMVSGVIVAGFGAGSFVFNFIVTAWINPDDLSCDVIDDDGNASYYSKESGVPERVPGMYRLLGICFAVLGCAGCALLREEVEEGGDETKSLLDGNSESVAEDDENSNNTNSKDQDISSAFLLGFSFICCGTGGLYLAGSYKSFGESILPTSLDSYFTTTGSVNSIFNAMGRIMWGLIADRIGVFNSLAIMSGLFPIFFAIYSGCGDNEGENENEKRSDDPLYARRSAPRLLAHHAVISFTSNSLHHQ